MTLFFPFTRLCYYVPQRLNLDITVACGVGFDTVVITVLNEGLNLAEVQLFNRGQQLSRDGLTFSMGSEYNSGQYPASNCNDGVIPASASDPRNFCHTDAPPFSTLTIQINSGVTAVDQIKIWNRVDCCQFRINGATVAAYASGALVWSTIVPSTSALMYSFVIGNQQSNDKTLKIPHG